MKLQLEYSFFKKKKKKAYIFAYLLWLCWVFVAACRLSLVASSRGCSLAVEHRLLIAMPALVVASRLERVGVSVIAAHVLSSCGTQA